MTLFVCFVPTPSKSQPKRGYLPEGKQLHAHLIKFGFCHVLSLQNQILSVYLKCKETEDAEKLFDGLPVRNVVSWNIMIRGIIGSCDNENELDRKQLCFSYFKRMLLEMVVPDYITLNGLICSCARFCDAEMGIQLHCFTVKVGFDLDRFVGCALVDLYAKYGFVENAMRVFVLLLLEIWLCGNYGDGNEVMRLLREMLREGFLPDELTISSVISSCGYASAITETLQAHAFAVKLSCHVFFICCQFFDQCLFQMW
ncbi:pentatricopeptide repeat-containing protein At2g33680 [Lathyrus oleraceus]|uniref:pentatricopeptide repeat-containing protein At2g33680 n=1 Tax=Pisum sativum TaxID=3888 RepID=UPI0021CF9047|nr:pentatricopeptide repeat-containing protein At2g33680-like [Pisum sativum]